MPLILSSASSRSRYHTFHSSNEIAIRLLLPRTAPTWSAVATTEEMKRSMSTADARKRRVAVLLLVVRVARDVVDVVVRVAQHDALPFAERRHLCARRAADHELQAGVELPQRLGRLGGDRPVRVGRAVAQLPRAVHLVAEAPHPDVERRRTAVRDPLLAARRTARDVRVLQQVQRLRRTARAEVHREHGLATDLLEPVGELVQAG